MDRAGFSREEQPAIDGLGELRPAIGKTGRRIRIRAERKRIDAPAVNTDRLDARGEGAAKKADKIRHGALKKSAVAAGFQFVDGIQTTATGALRGAGNTLAPFLTQVVCYWIIAMPLGMPDCRKPVDWPFAGTTQLMVASANAFPWLR